MDKNKHQTFKSGLYLVSTPIGNIEDITFRALNILRKSHIILCEDTRRSGKLLTYYKIKNKLIPYHKFNEKKIVNKIVNYIKKNKIGTKVVSCKTVRDKNFIAYSSRLKRLNNYEKSNLIKIIKYLKNYKKNLNLKKKNYRFSQIKNKLLSLGAKKVDYIEIIDLKRLVPWDKDMVLESVKKTKCVVTAEEHQLNGGLGDSIAQLLSSKLPTPIEMVGVNDSFGESGTPRGLMEKYGLTAKEIVGCAKKVIYRK